MTPVRNESWIIGRFLRAAEQWADHVVIADQGSTDSTVAIAREFDKVRVVENPAGAYDEGARQRLLLSAARELPEPRVIVALDADEFLTPNWAIAPEWRELTSAAPGTVFRFDWVNLLPDGERAWIPPEKVPYAFVDDGSDHRGTEIHSTRVPMPGGDVRDMRQMQVLHLQYADWARMKSKQRWYQCWEWMNGGPKRAIQIYRQYHRMDAFPPSEVHLVDPEWLSAYGRIGVDLTPAESDGPFWWDEEVLGWIAARGAREFARIDVWDTDWADIAEKLGCSVTRSAVEDPRRRSERAVHRWLRRTQPRAETSLTRWCQRALIPFGW